MAKSGSGLHSENWKSVYNIIYSELHSDTSSENKLTKLGEQLQDVYGRKSPERFGHNCPGSYIKIRIQNLLGRLEKTTDNMYVYRIHSSEYRGTNSKN